ncbi:FIST signal transduction protein [Dongia sp.]|uniref:FIST signal transduction protein n=1 Tax=Dongia sp. TaxID=1977262 RepID=UPI0035B29ECC
MVRLATFSARGADTAAVLEELAAILPVADAHLAFVFHGAGHDAKAIAETLNDLLPCPFIGGTSHAGAMLAGELMDAQALSLLLIEDDGGYYGVAARALPADADAAAAARAARETLLEALREAGTPGELPALVWLYQTPGYEEAILDGLRSVIGDNCPIVGGSAADEDIGGNWFQVTPAGAMASGIALAVLFPSGALGFAFQGGYKPTGQSGLVTRVEGIGAVSRTVLEIDHQPAAQVLDRWVDGGLGRYLVGGGNVLGATNLNPLGMTIGSFAGIPQYLLLHPETVRSDGAITLFAAVKPGDRLHQMQGDKDVLIERAGIVAREAVSRLTSMGSTLAGGLMVYCAGCRMAVGERMPEVAMQVADSFADAPFAGCFTFGEQGQIAGRNAHGNLMVAAIAFGQ